MSDGTSSGGRLHGDAKGAGEGGPARGYSWEPFREGNLVALRHGARSPRVFGPIASALAAAIFAERPYLERFPEAVAAWAQAEARASLLREHVERVGMFDDEGEPRSGVLAWLARFEKLAAETRQRIGLDPRSDAEVISASWEAARAAVDLDRLRREGAALVPQHLRSLEPAASEANDDERDDGEGVVEVEQPSEPRDADAEPE